MAALPYIQLYVADYLSDTMHLSVKEHGAYLLIIMNYWQTGKPIRPERIPLITRMSEDEWQEIEPTIKEFFEVNEDGHWSHFRIDEDLRAVLAKSEKSRRAGIKSGKKRRQQAIEKQSKTNERSTDVQLEFEPQTNHTDTNTNTEANTEGKAYAKTPEKNNNVPYQKIADLYHKILPDNPRIASLSTTRKSHIRARWKNEIKSLESWEKYFTLVSTSDFLTGKTQPSPGRKTFTAGIDFLINQSNVIKIIERQYHD